MTLDWLREHADGIIAVGQYGFVLTLLPIVIDPASVVPLWTSLPAVAILLTFAVTFHAEGKPHATLSSALNAVVWALVAILRHPPA